MLSWEMYECSEIDTFSLLQQLWGSFRCPGNSMLGYEENKKVENIELQNSFSRLWLFHMENLSQNEEDGF